MTDIELRNENGKIVGYDSDGNKVPVSFEDGVFDKLNANKAQIGAGTTKTDLEQGRLDGELTIRPSDGDNTGSATVYPSGNQNRSHWLVANNSDFDNYGGVKFEIQGNTADIEAFSKGTGTTPTELVIRDFSGMDVEASTTFESTVDITGSSFIKAPRNDTHTCISAQSFVNITDNEQTDVRNELNSSQQFVPDVSGFYLFICDASTTGGAAGDLIRIRVRDVDNGNDVGGEKRWKQEDSNGYGQRIFVKELTAGTAYEVQITNNDSGDWDLEKTGTELTIKSNLHQV